MRVPFDFEFKDQTVLDEVMEIIDTLSKDDRELMMRRFGIPPYKAHTQVRLGEIFKVSQPIITRRLKKIYCQIKKNYKDSL